MQQWQRNVLVLYPHSDDADDEESPFWEKEDALAMLGRRKKRAVVSVALAVLGVAVGAGTAAAAAAAKAAESSNEVNERNSEVRRRDELFR
jgi:hypothetical protein